MNKLAEMGVKMTKAGLIGWGLSSWTKFVYKAGMEAERKRQSEQASKAFEAALDWQDKLIAWDDVRLSPRVRNLPPEEKEKIAQILGQVRDVRRDEHWIPPETAMRVEDVVRRMREEKGDA